MEFPHIFRRYEMEKVIFSAITETKSNAQWAQAHGIDVRGEQQGT